MIRVISILLTCFFLTSCSQLEKQPGTIPAAWFDMPLPETVIYPPNPCQIVAHGSSVNGIAQFELRVNGANPVSIPAPDTNTSLTSIEYNCSLIQPGRNVLQLRAKDSSGSWSDFTETSVILASIRDVETPLPTITSTPPRRLTDTPLPTNTPTNTLMPSLTITSTSTHTPTKTVATGISSGVTIERVSTDLVYLGGSSCGTREVTILARASASNGIKVVVLFYRFRTANSTTQFQNVAMKSIGNDLYEYTLNPTSLLGGSVPFDEATLQYQIVVQQKNGDVSVRTPVMADIAVQACGGVTASCAAFTTESKCLNHGCNWVAIPAVIPQFECQNP
jgi:hypothetical protein